MIKNKDLLPVTRLNFGRTLWEVSSGIYTLGKFQCSGKAAVNGMPSSCADLWRIGHILNGFYFVMRDTMVESVYCDFTKLPSEKDFQNCLGFVDVKSCPVYFYVQRNTPYNAPISPITFELERVNIGGAMNLTTGIFTAPRTGVYFFAFTGLPHFTSSTNYFGVYLVLNGKNIGSNWAERKGSYGTLSLQSTLTLKAGDTVWLKISGMANANFLDNENHYTHFTGQLLQEDISQSLSSSLLGSNVNK